MEPDISNDGGDDIVVTDKELFDQAVTPPEPVAEAETPPETQEAKAERARDEQGRFMKAETPTPAELTEATPLPDSAKKTIADAAKAEPKDQDHRVPLRELLDERERRQQVARELEQLRAWQQQVLMAQRQQQQPRQEPPNIFDNPDTYLNQRFVQPLQQWGQMGMMQVKDGLSREMANTQFTEQVVNDALAEMAKVRQTPEGNFAYQQIMSSGHPYGALVKWHQETKVRQEIGSDPKAYRQKVIDEAMKDPEIQAKFVELIRGQQKGSGRPPVVSLPPSLSSVPAASGPTEEAGDMSDRSLFNFATK